METCKSTLKELSKEVVQWIADIARTTLKSLGSALSSVFLRITHWLLEAASSLLWWLWHGTGLQHMCQIILTVLKVTVLTLSLALAIPCTLLLAFHLFSFYVKLVREVVHFIHREFRARRSRNMRLLPEPGSAPRINYNTFAAVQQMEAPPLTSSRIRRAQPQGPHREQGTIETCLHEPQHSTIQAKPAAEASRDLSTPIVRIGLARPPCPPPYIPHPDQRQHGHRSSSPLGQARTPSHDTPPSYNHSDNSLPPPYVAACGDE
jgi:hypothetical protein